MLRVGIIVWLVVTGVAAVVLLVRRLRGGAEAKVIERQVVVARCAHCAALTPIDRRTCASCGAPT